LALGETARARDWLERAVLLDPDNLMMRYNLACTFAQGAGTHDEALDALESFFDWLKTSENIRHLEADPDMDPIRDHPRFKRMLAAAKQRLGMAAAAE